GGWWTRPTLRAWVARELGKTVSRSPISRLVHELGVARRVPRPQHRKRDAQAQVEVKKTLPSG
ncbi:MAG: helix-turn-helix domain-containing protein, partial [Chloroflexus sp.]|uniref:helix-turn-helix domain-containing protein n=1 Tax=Chloroflexus sp. TaxID=1904827 RepID=UPI00404B6DAB